MMYDNYLNKKILIFLDEQKEKKKKKYCDQTFAIHFLC